MIFITGDTHARFERFSSKKFPLGRELVKSDYVIIVGDFGGIWDVNESSPRETYGLNWLNDKPWTTLFIDGNHENFDRLDEMPVETMFGGPVGVIRPSILHLKRGYVYEIQETKIFTFGGGYSLDKERRRDHVSWWARELPNHTEYERGLKNLESFNNSVDYIITHSCSQRDFESMSQSYDMVHKENDDESQLRRYFDLIQDQTEYKSWFCGHFHVNHQINDTVFLYETIVELKQ